MVEFFQLIWMGVFTYFLFINPEHIIKFRERRGYKVKDKRKYKRDARLVGIIPLIGFIQAICWIVDRYF